MWHLDHVFVMTPPGAPHAGTLGAHGFAPGGSAEHRGQGTANCWFPFANAYLELLYPTDDALLRSAPVLPTGLWERSRWKTSGASPFGICLRGEGHGGAPVPTWEYHAPFLPRGAFIPIAVDPAGPRAPVLFFNTSPAPGRALAAGGRRISTVRIESPVVPGWLDAITGVAPFLQIAPGPRHAMTIDLNGAASGCELSLGDDAPLSIRW